MEILPMGKIALPASLVRDINKVLAEKAKSNKGRVKVAKELLEELLPFPKGTKILSVGQDDGFGIEFIVQGASLPGVEGEEIPEVHCIITEEKGKVISSKFKLM
jgi:hypothetical protein